MESRPTFVLVHGAFHGPWVWDRLKPRLASKGYSTRAVELSPSISVEAGPAEILAKWTDDVSAIVEECVSPVILVGHSRSGIVISQVAERLTHRISLLVYCAAMLVKDGETMALARKRLEEPSNMLLRISRDPQTDLLVVDPTSAREAIYSHCNPAEAAWAADRLRPEPAAGFKIAPQITQQRYGSVPRAMIECTNDKVSSLSLQRKMRRDPPCHAVITLNCDHAPYLSNPAALAKALDFLASTIRISDEPPSSDTEL